MTWEHHPAHFWMVLDDRDRDAVNVAARLEGKAPAGGVAISVETLSMIPGARTEPLGELSVKGRAAPVEAYSLLAIDAVEDLSGAR